MKREIAAFDGIPPDSIQGCTEAEVQLIQRSQNVPTLPELYRQLMLQMGRGIPEFQGTLIWTYPGMLTFNEQLGNLANLGENVFVFAIDDSGEGIFFFNYLDGPSPAISVLGPDDDSPKIYADSVGDFLMEYFGTGD